MICRVVDTAARCTADRMDPWWRWVGRGVVSSITLCVRMYSIPRCSATSGYLFRMVACIGRGG